MSIQISSSNAKLNYAFSARCISYFSLEKFQSSQLPLIEILTINIDSYIDSTGPDYLFAQHAVNASCNNM